jgi:hypothetical protein
MLLVMPTVNNDYYLKSTNRLASKMKGYDVSCKVQSTSLNFYIKKVKRSRYRPGVAQRVGRVTALLFHDRGARRGWVVSSTPRPNFTPGKDQIPIVQDAGWAPGPVYTVGKSRHHRDSNPERPARSQSLYRLSYPAHKRKTGITQMW